MLKQFKINIRTIKKIIIVKKAIKTKMINY